MNDGSRPQLVLEPRQQDGQATGYEGLMALAVERSARMIESDAGGVATVRAGQDAVKREDTPTK